jgi:hypothetical protein
MKIFLLILFFSAHASADSLNVKQGNSFFILNFRFTNAEDSFDDNGEKIPLNGDFTDFLLNLYGEYGITDDLTLTAGITGYRYIRFESNPGPEYDIDTVSGIGDGSIGLRKLFFQLDETAIFGEINLNLPFGKSEPDGEFLIGTGDFYQGISILAEHFFYPVPAFLRSVISFNNRTEGYSDEFIYEIKSGYFFYTDLTVALNVSGIQPLYNGKNYKTGGLGVLLNNKKYFAVGGEVTYKISKNIRLAALYENPVFGKNNISSPVYSFKILFNP